MGWLDIEAASLLRRRAVVLAEFEIDLKDVDHLFACKPAKRRKRLILENLFNLGMHGCRVAFGIGSPFRESGRFADAPECGSKVETETGVVNLGMNPPKR